MIDENSHNTKEYALVSSGKAILFKTEIERELPKNLVCTKSRKVKKLTNQY